MGAREHNMLPMLVSLCLWHSAAGATGWKSLPDAPWQGRSHMTMAYDPSSGSYLAFGGTSGWNGTSPELYWSNDTWQVDSQGDWHQKASGPWQPRQNPGVAISSELAILAGGEAWHPPTQTHDTWNDVWELELSTGAWRQLATAPWGVRTGHSMVLSGDRIIMTGGGSCRSCVWITKYHDVWSFDLKSKQWTQLADAPWKA